MALFICLWYLISMSFPYQRSTQAPDRSTGWSGEMGFPGSAAAGRMLNVAVARLIGKGPGKSRMGIFTEIRYACARSVESIAAA